jgi:hypothetical protein
VRRRPRRLEVEREVDVDVAVPRTGHCEQVDTVAVRRDPRVRTEREEVVRVAPRFLQALGVVSGANGVRLQLAPAGMGLGTKHVSKIWKLIKLVHRLQMRMFRCCHKHWE